MKIEYRVRPVTRFIVTRFSEGDGRNPSGCETKGEYDNAEVAYQVGYALCKAEHDRLGYQIDDERVQYPHHPDRQGVGVPNAYVGPHENNAVTA